VDTTVEAEETSKRREKLTMSRTIMKNVLTATALGILAIALLTGQAQAREITDMAGRKVSIPDTIRKVYAPSPYGSYALYSIDPSLVSGLILPIKEEDKKYVNKALIDLPVIGSLSGQGQTANIEVLLKAKPDLIIMWSAEKSAVNTKAEETLKKLNIPYVYAIAENLYEYPEAYRFLGNVLNRKEKAGELAAYCQKTLADTKAAMDRVPTAKRPTVYYAEGVDGLSTECNDSIHVELLRITGNRNVHQCHTSSHMGMEKVSLEQVMLYNPDVIVAQEKVFFDKVLKDARWQGVKAVKEGRVYLIPRAPYNWFDRPPSFMRIMGLKWLMGCLYPAEQKGDIIREAREFYKLFLGVDLSNEEMKNVIHR
jgi:iron complex transport system substrate-binding protein